MDEGLLDSVAGDAHVPEPARGRARHRARADHDRQLRLDRDRGRAASCLQGKGIVNSISLKEGEEAFLRAGAARPALRRRRRRDGLRRAGPGRHASSGASRSCPRAYRILTDEVGFPPEDIILDPNVLTVGTGIEEHADYARGLHRGDAPAQGRRCRARKVSGGISQRLVLLPRQQPGARGHARGLPLPRDPGRPRHGDRQRRAARGLRGDPEGPAASSSRTCCSNRRPDATERLMAFAESVKARRRRSRPRGRLAAGRRSRSGSRTRWCAASTSSSRPTPRRRGRSTAGRSP